MRDADVSRLLLDWYDVHAREMPWRVGPAARSKGVLPDPYRIWMSEVMLQQTTVAAVRDYFSRFVKKWPTVGDLAAAADGDVMAEWAGLGYYARARNLLACARAVVALGGVFPNNLEGLLRLPGVGPYTAAAVASIAYDLPEVVVDGNVERVMARFFAVEEPLPLAKPALVDLAARVTPQMRAGDYAQAVMDLGATICSPRSPACGICPLMTGCAARARGIAGELPRKLAKPEKPVRRGGVWIATQGDLVLVERRPERGLLGGMLGFLGDGWDGSGGGVPFAGEWQELGEIKHTFTHFHLILKVMRAQARGNPERGAYQNLNPEDLPTVMRKAYDLAFKGKTSR